jgi:hypothetical protein
MQTKIVEHMPAQCLSAGDVVDRIGRHRDMVVLSVQPVSDERYVQVTLADAFWNIVAFQLVADQRVAVVD